MKKFLFLLCSLAVLCGCKSIGPSAIRSAHPGFNEAIAQTLDEQLLLNLVRMKYRDNTFFLEIGSISDSRTLAFKAGMDDTVLRAHSRGGDCPAEWNPIVGVSTSQTPTVVYTPLQGQSFIKRMFAPVPLPVVLNMSQSGWNVARVFSIFVERINDLDNALTASGPTPLHVPKYKKFYRFVSVLTQLIKNDMLLLGIEEFHDRNRLVMELVNTEENREIVEEFRHLLGVSSALNKFSFDENFLAVSDANLRIRLRSFQSAMFYLSNGIEIPQEHIDRGLVTITRDNQGEVFDWQRMLRNLLCVHSSKVRPSDAFLKVHYRGYWFYISDNDLASKSTFMLLSSVFSLQSGDMRTIVPTLTIPLNH